MEKNKQMLASISFDPLASLVYVEQLSEHKNTEAALCQGATMVLAGPYGIRDFSKAILRQDPRCFIDKSVLFLDGNCFVYATYNQQKHWAALHLKIVCGSLGFGKPPSEPWFEHGHREWTSVKQFMNGNEASWDWHVWCEDAEGCVYDIVPGLWHAAARVYGRKLEIGAPDKNTVIKGMHKAELKRGGLEYVAAPLETQGVLLSIASRLYACYFKKLKLHDEQNKNQM
jgi:hypothetical protein